MRVLGIDVGDELLDQWRERLMPEQQPFVVPATLAAERGWADGRGVLSFELLDAFELYGVGRNDAIVWLTRADARTLPQAVRRQQAAPHRWRSGDIASDRLRTVRYVEAGRRASRHRELAGRWADIERVLPGARAIAGTFPVGSGPNCFGAVMSAAGVEGAVGKWVQLEPFEEWLEASTSPTNRARDDEPGTVLVWRTDDGLPAHAAITLGGGYLLHKPSQGWMSPTKVLTVDEGKHSARQAGRHLTRRKVAS